MPLNTDERSDVVVAGAGAAGMALAIALKRRCGSDISVEICDPQAGQPARPDRRAYALNARSREFLESLGVWALLQDQAQAVAKIIITDSGAGDAARPCLLQFGEAGQAGTLFHVVEAVALGAALNRVALELGLTVRAAGIERFSADGSRQAVHLSDGAALRARLLVAADGAGSALRDEAGIAFFEGAYEQSALSGIITHERPHEGIAEQHFLPGGPFALLPLVDAGPGLHRSSFVWTISAKLAKRLAAKGPAAVSRAVIETLGGRLGEAEVAGGAAVFPLQFGIAKRLTAERFALAGDAAQVIHPLAGQGMNLAFGGVEALAAIITGQLRLGLDPGAPECLQRYENAARFDSAAMLLLTDAMNRLFSNDSRALRAVRDFGLGLVERSAVAKAFFERQAAG